MSNKSILIREEVHSQLKELSLKFNRNIGQVAEQSILYFSKTGIDPAKSDLGANDQLSISLDNQIDEKLSVLERTLISPLIKSNQGLIDALKSPEGIKANFDLGPVFLKSKQELTAVENQIQLLFKNFFLVTSDMHDFNRIMEFNKERYLKLKQALKEIRSQVHTFLEDSNSDPDFNLRAELNAFLKRIENLAKQDEY